MDNVIDTIYEIIVSIHGVGFLITGAITFIGFWIYCIATYGFLLGVSLGWFPSLIAAAIIGALWPLPILGIIVLIAIGRADALPVLGPVMPLVLDVVTGVFSDVSDVLTHVNFRISIFGILVFLGYALITEGRKAVYGSLLLIGYLTLWGFLLFIGIRIAIRVWQLI